MPFLIDRIAHLANEHGDHLALEHGDTRLSYAQLYEQIVSVAHTLESELCAPGDRVAIICTKSIETVITFFACLACNRCAVMINPILKPDQVTHILVDSQATVLQLDATHLQRLQSSLSKAPSLTKIIQPNINSNEHASNTDELEYIDWNHSIRISSNQHTPLTAIQDHSLACLLYTSGSTGLPKGVMISQQNLVLGADSVCQYLHTHSEDRILALLPFSFDYGLNQLTHALFAGATLILYDYLLAADVLKAIEKKSISGLAGVPTLWSAIVDTAASDNNFHELRYITSSGGVLSTPLIDQLLKRFPHTQIFSMYGTTEAFRSSYLPPAEITTKPKSIGKAVPYAELHVLDKQLQPCNAGKIGEIVHAGPLVTLGYWQNDSATSRAGFDVLPKHLQSKYEPGSKIFRTGDLGYVDEEGYLYFTGRKDDMIKSSGYRISPVEIETIAMQIPGVAQAIALAMPNEHLGQSITLVLTTNECHQALRERTHGYFQANAPHYMVPAVIIVTEEIPLTPNGKPDRSELLRQINTDLINHS